MRDGAPELLSGLLGALDPGLRAAAVFALGCLIHSRPRAGPGGVPLPPDPRAAQQQQQQGASPHSSSASLAAGAASLGVGAGGGLGASASSASLGGGMAGEEGSAGGAAAAAALLEAAIAAEQGVAALLLRANVVYDASALVRCELAAALARFVRGHLPLMEGAIAELKVRRAARGACGVGVPP